MKRLICKIPLLIGEVEPQFSIGDIGYLVYASDGQCFVFFNKDETSKGNKKQGWRFDNYELVCKYFKSDRRLKLKRILNK